VNKEKSMKMKKLMFCPKCKSVDVKKNITASIVFGAPQMYECEKCGFKGYIFPEVEIKKQKKK